jgi:thioester reductase-like protein
MWEEMGRKGYLNRPELTNERFTYNPYKPGEKIYKSGDAGRWYANGEIEYLGRLDYQIKIHGFRVELGEIENKISEFPGIIDIAVLVSEDEVGDNILIAYFVANQEISIQELRKFLGISLPQYMIPAEYVQLDSMPLTSSGKVNRKELKKIERKKTTYNEYCAPRNDSETRMAEILQDVLDIERIGIKDNFFELGIDSLKIIQVQVKAVSFDWGIRTQDFYRYPTIELLYDNIIKQQDRVNYLLNNDYNYKISDILKEEGSKAFRNVLLTGATGFLGIHMLNALLLFTDAKILCLIRKDSIDEDLKYYFKNIDENLLKRITIIKGDISKDCLGLDNQKYEFLIENVDTIIHSAANVRHYGSIDDFNKTNVEGTRQMLALCKKCNAVFHHISTISISGTNLIASSADPKVFAENDFYIGQNIFENVYLYTKFEAERLVLDEAKQGMKVNIYRLGNITGRYSDGVFQRNIYENAFYRRIKSLLMIGSISDQMANIEIDMTPVDICSKAIIDIIKRGNVNCVYHLYSKKFKVRNLVEVINNLVSDSVKIVENNEFIRVIRALSEDKEKQYSLEGLINELNIASGFDYNEDIITSNAKTLEMLETLDIYWPDTYDSLYIEKLIRHMKDVGFLESGIL